MLIFVMLLLILVILYCLLFQVCCFVPFFDFGENETRLEHIRDAADIGLTLIEWGSNSEPV